MKLFISKNRAYSIILLLFAIITMIFTLNQLTLSRRSSASIIKKYSQISSDSSINTITYNGEEMYVAKATFYDYYSDSQVGTSSTPDPITDALNTSKNTFSKFNNKIMSLLKYNDPKACPATYPLYQGRPGRLSDMVDIYNPSNEETAKKSNYWVAAHSAQGTVAATQGLVNSTLKYDSYGNSVITQTNNTNGKSSILPYFDKKFLTSNTFDNSKLTLGKVIENVSFPFRRINKDGIIYYEFYSSKDTVRLNSNNQLDYFGINDSSNQVRDAEGNPGFFPYNNSSEGKSSSLNFGHGVKIEIPFNMTKDGKINNKDMIFEFSGDDDVWIFIDNELALDLGGNHGEVSGNINFSKSVATVKKAKNPAIAFATRHTASIKNTKNSVINDLETQFSTTLKTKLADTTKTHTLTMFYMERGLNVANMKLSFNLIEPTKLIIDNTLDTSNINKTFTASTLEVAKKDSFIMDVADKTISKAAKIDLLPDENVAFINEFDTKDKLIIQESSLKDTSRKLTSLYSTSWVLKDSSSEINKDSSLLITDKRSKDNESIIFSNKNNDIIPNLRATYTNAPKTGAYMLVCKVTDAFISKYKNYAEKTFKYTITYCNVFGGKSTSTPYKGPYTVYDINNKTSEKNTTDGTITLRPGEKALIKDIPVLTIISSNISLNDNSKIKSINATKQFNIDNTKLQASGEITSDSNTVQYTITSEEEEIQQIINNTIPLSNGNTSDKTKKNTTKLVDIPISEDAFDSSPQTDDSFQYAILFILTICCIFIMLLSIHFIIKNNKY